MDVFEALADPVRRDLLRRLASGTARVVDLARGQEISRPAISRHLRVLGEAGLVSADDVGRERHYRLERSALATVQGFVAELTAPATGPRFDASALDGLDLEVRRTERERTTSRTPARREHSTEETA